MYAYGRDRATLYMSGNPGVDTDLGKIPQLGGRPQLAASYRTQVETGELSLSHARPAADG